MAVLNLLLTYFVIYCLKENKFITIKAKTYDEFIIRMLKVLIRVYFEKLLPAPCIHKHNVN